MRLPAGRRTGCDNRYKACQLKSYLGTLSKTCDDPSGKNASKCMESPRKCMWGLNSWTSTALSKERSATMR